MISQRSLEKHDKHSLTQKLRLEKSITGEPMIFRRTVCEKKLQGASCLGGLDTELGLQVFVHCVQVVQGLYAPCHDFLLCVFDALPNADCVQVARPPLHNIEEKLVCRPFQFGFLCLAKARQVDGECRLETSSINSLL